MKSFKAVVVEEIDGKFEIKLKEKEVDALPSGDVLVNVKYSSINYKDALSCSGNKGVTKSYPHTPGIDAAGIVEESTCDEFRKGDEVIVIGFDLGMNTPGGFAEYIRVPKSWVVKKPSGLSLREYMIYGTAGVTAALSVDKLIQYGIKVGYGKIAVTGATGGVGLFSIAILSGLGYDVVAITGKMEEADYLKSFGAKEVVDRKEFEQVNTKALLKPQFIAAVDTVGGEVLVNVIKSINYGGAVAVCGMAFSPNISLTVFPFILRGVSLLGIDSVEIRKNDILNKISNVYKLENLDRFSTEIGLEDISGAVEKIKKGEVKGRYLVRVS
ncbi:MAG: YhdH/YhfP family quinone oxidoreductase [Calditerrivibrio sp.]|nr:YhdH/YhfP family quinone oxidoreductase [Calditerrivibrio sp.]